jgi:serine phosphatase RsbU (regulator of sigma subunit)
MDKGLSRFSKESFLIKNVSIILIFLATPYIGIFLYLDLIFPGLLVTICVATYVLCVFFRDKHILSGLLIISVSSLALFYCSSAFGKDIGAHTFYFGFISIAVTIFISKHKALLVLAVSIPFTCLSLLEYQNFEMIEKIIVPSFFHELITYCAYTPASCLVGLSIYALYLSEKLYKNKLILKNNTLKDLNKKLKKVAKRDADYKLARSFQKQYLPELYNYNGIKPSVLHEPSSRMVSGDFYDTRSSSDSSIGYFLIDVAGKGIEASYVAIQLHMLLRTKINSETSPKKIMQIINHEVTQLKTLKKMCVGAYLSFNTINKTLSYCRASLDILWVLRDGTIIDLDTNNPPLGFSDMNDFLEDTIKYQEGDIIIASTDGILDARNTDQQRYSESRLKSVVIQYKKTSTNTLKDIIHKDLIQYIGTEPLGDDMTLLIFEL